MLVKLKAEIIKHGYYEDSSGMYVGLRNPMDDDGHYYLSQSFLKLFQKNKSKMRIETIYSHGCCVCGTYIPFKLIIPVGELCSECGEYYCDVCGVCESCTDKELMKEYRQRLIDFRDGIRCLMLPESMEKFAALWRAYMRSKKADKHMITFEDKDLNMDFLDDDKKKEKSEYECIDVVNEDVTAVESLARGLLAQLEEDLRRRDERVI